MDDRMRLEDAEQLMTLPGLPKEFELEGRRYQYAGSSAYSLGDMLVRGIGDDELWIEWACFDKDTARGGPQKITLVFIIENASVRRCRVQYLSRW